MPNCVKRWEDTERPRRNFQQQQKGEEGIVVEELSLKVEINSVSPPGPLLFIENLLFEEKNWIVQYTSIYS